MKKICLFLFALVYVALLISPAFAKNSYDEKAVMAHDVAKIKTFKTNIAVDSTCDENVKLATENYLNSKKYFKKHKNGIFFVKIKNNQIKKIYEIKNPEQVLFALNDDFSEEQMSNKQETLKYLKSNIKAKAAISEKIDHTDRNLIRKSTELSMEGIKGLNNIMPLNIFRGAVNAIFEVFTTNDKEIYNKILKEVSLMKDGKKNYVIIMLPSEQKPVEAL